MPEKKEEKHPLDMTTDEAMEFLLGQEGAQKLKEAVHATNPPPPDDDSNGSGSRARSTRKHDTT